MKIKKIIGMLLIAVILLGLAACTPAVTDPTTAPTATMPGGITIDPSEYVFNLPEEDYDFGGQTFVVFSYHAQAFEQRQDFIRRYALDSVIKSRYNVDIRYDLDYQRGATDALAGSPTIDVGLMGLHTMFVYYNAGAIEPWDDYFAELHYDGTDSIRWDARDTTWNSMGGKVYGMAPVSYELWKYHNVFCMFMNKNLLTQRGIDPKEIYTLQENKQWTWDKFAEYAERVTCDINHDDVNDVYGTAMNGFPLLTGLMTSTGTNYIKYDEATRQFSYAPDDNFNSVLTFMKSLLVSDACRAPGSMNGLTENNDISDFMDGKIGFYAYIFQRTWQAGFLGEMSDDYGVLCFPMPAGQTEYYISDNRDGGWGLFAHPDKEKCREIAKFLYVYKTPLFNMNDPSDEQEAFWDEALNRIRDEESRYYLQLVFDQTNVIANNNTTFLSNGLYNLMNLDNIWTGAMTVQEAIQSSLPVCQEFMITFYNKTGV
ncbi:MAG: extracellular solute-binding protein [Eubacteriales bacterium]|nr:extracellular solute-binding protein [Eubacteriales bacterium]